MLIGLRDNYEQVRAGVVRAGVVRAGVVRTGTDKTVANLKSIAEG